MPKTLAATLIPISMLFLASLVPASELRTAPASPRETVEGGIAELASVFAPQPPEPPAQLTSASRRARVQQVVGSIVDFDEMSRRTLGAYWGRLSPAEQTQFVALFTKLIDRSYLGKLDQIVGQRLSFVSETITGAEAIVTAKIGQQPNELAPEYSVRRGGDTEIEFRLHRRDDRWRVYDLGVDSFRLVEMYRSQFSRVIQTESYPALVSRLQKKLDRAAASIPRS